MMTEDLIVIGLTVGATVITIGLDIWEYYRPSKDEAKSPTTGEE